MNTDPLRRVVCLADEQPRLVHVLTEKWTEGRSRPVHNRPQQVIAPTTNRAIFFPDEITLIPPMADDPANVRHFVVKNTGQYGYYFYGQFQSQYFQDPVSGDFYRPFLDNGELESFAWYPYLSQETNVATRWLCKSTAAIICPDEPGFEEQCGEVAGYWSSSSYSRRQYYWMNNKVMYNREHNAWFQYPPWINPEAVDLPIVFRADLPGFNPHHPLLRPYGKVRMSRLQREQGTRVGQLSAVPAKLYRHFNLIKPASYTPDTRFMRLHMQYARGYNVDGFIFNKPNENRYGVKLPDIPTLNFIPFHHKLGDGEAYRWVNQLLNGRIFDRTISRPDDYQAMAMMRFYDACDGLHPLLDELGILLLGILSTYTNIGGEYFDLVKYVDAWISHYGPRSYTDPDGNEVTIVPDMSHRVDYLNVLSRAQEWYQRKLAEVGLPYLTAQPPALKQPAPTNEKVVHWMENMKLAQAGNLMYNVVNAHVATNRQLTEVYIDTHVLESQSTELRYLQYPEIEGEEPMHVDPRMTYPPQGQQPVYQNQQPVMYATQPAPQAAPVYAAPVYAAPAYAAQGQQQVMYAPQAQAAPQAGVASVIIEDQFGRRTVPVTQLRQEDMVNIVNPHTGQRMHPPQAPVYAAPQNMLPNGTVANMNNPVRLAQPTAQYIMPPHDRSPAPHGAAVQHNPDGSRLVTITQASVPVATAALPVRNFTAGTFQTTVNAAGHLQVAPPPQNAGYQYPAAQAPIYPPPALQSQAQMAQVPQGLRPQTAGMVGMTVQPQLQTAPVMQPIVDNRVPWTEFDTQYQKHQGVVVTDPRFLIPVLRINNPNKAKYLDYLMVHEKFYDETTGGMFSGKPVQQIEQDYLDRRAQYGIPDGQPLLANGAINVGGQQVQQQVQQQAPEVATYTSQPVTNDSVSEFDKAFPRKSSMIPITEPFQIPVMQVGWTGSKLWSGIIRGIDPALRCGSTDDIILNEIMCSGSVDPAILPDAFKFREAVLSSVEETIDSTGFVLSDNIALWIGLLIQASPDGQYEKYIMRSRLKSLTEIAQSNFGQVWPGSTATGDHLLAINPSYTYGQWVVDAGLVGSDGVAELIVPYIPQIDDIDVDTDRVTRNINGIQSAYYKDGRTEVCDYIRPRNIPREGKYAVKKPAPMPVVAQEEVNQVMSIEEQRLRRAHAAMKASPAYPHNGMYIQELEDLGVGVPLELPDASFEPNRVTRRELTNAETADLYLDAFNKCQVKRNQPDSSGITIYDPADIDFENTGLPEVSKPVEEVKAVEEPVAEPEVVEDKLPEIVLDDSLTSRNWSSSPFQREMAPVMHGMRSRYARVMFDGEEYVIQVVTTIRKEDKEELENMVREEHQIVPLGTPEHIKSMLINFGNQQPDLVEKKGRLIEEGRFAEVSAKVAKVPVNFNVESAGSVIQFVDHATAEATKMEQPMAITSGTVVRTYPFTDPMKMIDVKDLETKIRECGTFNQVGMALGNALQEIATCYPADSQHYIAARKAVLAIDTTFVGIINGLTGIVTDQWEVQTTMINEGQYDWSSLCVAVGDSEVGHLGAEALASIESNFFKQFAKVKDGKVWDERTYRDNLDIRDSSGFVIPFPVAVVTIDYTASEIGFDKLSDDYNTVGLSSKDGYLAHALVQGISHAKKSGIPSCLMYLRDGANKICLLHQVPNAFDDGLLSKVILRPTINLV